MNYEQALEQELSSITALEGRVYPLASPEAKATNGIPYLIYRSSEGQRTKTVGDGYGGDKTVQCEINVIARRYETMKTVTEQAIDVLVGMEGRTIGTGGPFIQEITYDPPVELYEEQPKLYRCLVDFEVYF